LGNVNNTSDADKPVSKATKAALDLKADTTYVQTAVGGATIPSGTTAGTAAALTLAISGFTLTDGVLVKAKLHTAVSGAVTLNVTSTGAKPIVNILGKQSIKAVASSWLVLVYSSTLGSFIWQGEGGDSGASGGGIDTFRAVIMGNFPPDFMR
jgi:hypothetical protein